QSARFDAPSDADVIPRALADKGQPEEVFDIRDDESAGRPEGSQDLGSSRIDLFERPPAEEPMQSLYHLAPGVESGLDLGSAEVIEEPVSHAESGVNPAEPVVEEVPAEPSRTRRVESGLDLGMPDIVTSEPASGPSSSGLDLGKPEVYLED